MDAVAAAPDDPDKALALAEAQVGVGQHKPAIDALLAIMRRHGAGWRDGLARTTLLKLLDTLGPGNPLTVDGRKQLSKLLFR